MSGGRETMFKTMFFSVSSYASTPGQCYARQTSKGTFFWAGKVPYVFMFLCEKIVPVDTLLCPDIYGTYISTCQSHPPPVATLPVLGSSLRGRGAGLWEAVV
jgi:hypothetical protein